MKRFTHVMTIVLPILMLVACTGAPLATAPGSPALSTEAPRASPPAVATKTPAPRVASLPTQVPERESTVVGSAQPGLDRAPGTRPLVPNPLPASRRSYTVTTGGFSFACPKDWLVELPTPPALPIGPTPLRLFTPPARFPGGNQVLVYYSSYAIAPGQSLEEWNRQVFLASQDGMIPPREILHVEELPPVEPAGQALLVTHLAGPDAGWHRHQLYLAHGELVLEMWAEVMPEESPQTVQALREIAATIRFLPSAPRQLAAVYHPLPGPQLASVAATATAVTSITPSPSCDLTCRDATAWAGATPGPTLTYPPAMATRERQYLQLLSTATVQAAAVTPTTLPPRRPRRLAAQPGLVLYKGQSPAGPEWVERPFQLGVRPERMAVGERVRHGDAVSPPVSRLQAGYPARRTGYGWPRRDRKGVIRRSGLAHDLLDLPRDSLL